MGTETLFLVHPEEESSVFAAFLNIHEGNGRVLSYQHIGQHSECSLEYIAECREATRNEYLSLLDELVNLVGYDDIQILNKDK
jgi:hypothetical protein